jgi:tripartite-type tricarboxylate transporter receptor subunit TctC
MRAILALEGAEPIGSSPDEFAAQIRSELARWSKLVAAAGIKAD